MGRSKGMDSRGKQYAQQVVSKLKEKGIEGCPVQDLKDIGKDIFPRLAESSLKSKFYKVLFVLRTAGCDIAYSGLDRKYRLVNADRVAPDALPCLNPGSAGGYERKKEPDQKVKKVTYKVMITGVSADKLDILTGVAADVENITITKEV